MFMFKMFKIGQICLVCWVVICDASDIIEYD